MIPALEGVEALSKTVLDSVPPAGWLENAFKNIPGLCGISSYLSIDRHSVVEKACKELVAARPNIPSECWGETEERQLVARIVCEACSKGMGWPSSNFVPADSLQIVFYFGVYDAFDGEDTIQAIFEKLGILGTSDLLGPTPEDDDKTMLDLVIACEQLRQERQSLKQ